MVVKNSKHISKLEDDGLSLVVKEMAKSSGRRMDIERMKHFFEAIEKARNSVTLFLANNSYIGSFICPITSIISSNRIIK